MQYEYECEKCGAYVSKPFPMGKANKTVKCPTCKGRAARSFSSFAIGMNGGIDRKSTFGENMRKGNSKAAKKMRGKRPPVRTVAHDYGGGDIREV